MEFAPEVLAPVFSLSPHAIEHSKYPSEEAKCSFHRAATDPLISTSEWEEDYRIRRLNAAHGCSEHGLPHYPASRPQSIVAF